MIYCIISSFNNTYASLTFSVFGSTGWTKISSLIFEMIDRYINTNVQTNSLPRRKISTLRKKTYLQIGSSHRTPVQFSFSVPGPHKQSCGCLHVPRIQPVLFTHLSQLGLVHPASHLWKQISWEKV